MKKSEKEQIERIKKMDAVLVEAKAAVNKLGAALEEYFSLKPQIDELFEYYQSPLWMKDYDDDSLGRIPKDLRREVISQDAVYDLMEQIAELNAQFSERIPSSDEEENE